MREAIVQFAPEDQRDATLKQLHEVDHRIAVGGEAINDAINIIENLFGAATKIELNTAVKSRAADRAITKVAPFHRQRNGIDDAIIIETYIDALANKTDAEDVYGFITHNVHDFSEKGADTRLPHPDLAPLFDGKSSRYATNLGLLLNEFAEDVIEEIRFERNFQQEPRRLSELIEAAQKLETQVWYNRKWVLIDKHQRGKHKLVTRKEWEKANPKERQNMTIDKIWKGMLKSMRKAEHDLGPEEIGPWDDFDWGMINGKLSAIRWVLGDDWDMLDT